MRAPQYVGERAAGFLLIRRQPLMPYQAGVEIHRRPVVGVAVLQLPIEPIQLVAGSLDRLGLTLRASLRAIGTSKHGRRTLGRSPHPLVTGAMSIVRHSARSHCDYYEHHRCGNKHKLNRGQYQQIVHVNLPMQWPHSTNSLHRPVFL